MHLFPKSIQPFESKRVSWGCIHAPFRPTLLDLLLNQFFNLLFKLFSFDLSLSNLILPLALIGIEHVQDSLVFDHGQAPQILLSR